MSKLWDTIVLHLDTLDYVLIGFVILDYISGVLNAIIEHRLSSDVGAKGICKKIFIFIIIGISLIFDTIILKQKKLLKPTITLFYIFNESISILENASNSGLPIPDSIKKVVKNSINDQNNSTQQKK